MSSTVDNINANITNRFDALDAILSTYDEYELDDDDAALLNKSKNDLCNLLEQYTSNTISILKDYYDAETDVIRNLKRGQFVKSFHSMNIVGCLTRIYNTCMKFKKKYKIDETSIATLFKTYEMSLIDESFENDSADICKKCNTQYDIEEKTAEYVCKTCGHIEKMYGVVFEDEQFYYQEGQRTKHGKYDPIKHARFWLDRIQAKESTEIPEKVLNAVKRCIRRDQLWINKISCETVRSYLKQLKLTAYNNHVPLIRKVIAGIEPDQLTEHETNLTYMYFGIIIQIFIKIKDDGKSNCPYHPFFIYKIIEQILKSPKDAARRRNILSCIHLQSRDTLIENDKVWFVICDYIPEFTKIATDKA